MTEQQLHAIEVAAKHLAAHGGNGTYLVQPLVDEVKRLKAAVRYLADSNARLLKDLQRGKEGK